MLFPVVEVTVASGTLHSTSSFTPQEHELASCHSPFDLS